MKTTTESLSVMVEYVNRVLQANGFRTRVVKCEFIGDNFQPYQFSTLSGTRIVTPIADLGECIRLLSILKVNNKRKNFTFLPSGKRGRNCKEMIFFGESDRCFKLNKAFLPRNF